MRSPKDILVLTTAADNNIKVKKYLKPISAHVVAGTNIFSDFFGEISDVFGGRSKTYQKQLSSLYKEAIEILRSSAFEIGADCIVGLHIDMDEISGKGKSMFMVTAYGTAVVLEKNQQMNLSDSEIKSDVVSADKLKTLKKRISIIEKAETGKLELKEEVLDFIIANQVIEVLPFLLDAYKEKLVMDSTYPDNSKRLYQFLISFFDALPSDQQETLLYRSITEAETEKLAYRLTEIVRELNLFNFNKTSEIIQHPDFNIQKRALLIAFCDKPFYSKDDLPLFSNLIEQIKQYFPMRGSITTKKQLLSSKEKEVWQCECGKTNDLNSFCTGCSKDIYGFKADETKPDETINYLKNKAEMIHKML